MPESGKPLQRILCIDDDEDTCVLFTVVLSDYEVLTATSFNEAVHLIEEQSFDLYILDNWLGDGLGIHLCHYIRNTHPDAPVIFCSGVGLEGDRQAALASGARAYLVKPVEPDLLRMTVEQQLERAATRSLEAEESARQLRQFTLLQD